MASFYTNRGIKLLQAWSLRHGTDAPPANCRLMLVKGTPAPNVDTATMAELDEIDAGGGYIAGGMTVTLDATGFPTLVQDDDNDLADCGMAAQTWFATSPQLPISGPGPSFAVFTTPDVVIDDRQVIFVLDLGGEQIRAAGLPLTVGATSRGEHP